MAMPDYTGCAGGAETRRPSKKRSFRSGYPLSNCECTDGCGAQSKGPECDRTGGEAGIFLILIHRPSDAILQEPLSVLCQGNC